MFYKKCRFSLPFGSLVQKIWRRFSFLIWYAKTALSFVWNQFHFVSEMMKRVLCWVYWCVQSVVIFTNCVAVLLFAFITNSQQQQHQQLFSILTSETFDIDDVKEPYLIWVSRTRIRFKQSDSIQFQFYSWETKIERNVIYVTHWSVTSSIIIIIASIMQNSSIQVVTDNGYVYDNWELSSSN